MNFSEMLEGAQFQQEYEISPAVYEGFLTCFGDRNPLHVNEVYAKAHGFQGPVMHGAILSGFLSHAVGMHFPGESALLQIVDLRFLKPSYLNDRLNLTLKVEQKVEATQSLVLGVRFDNLTQSHLAARGRAQVGVRGNL